MKMLWMSDLHLDAVSDDQRHSFLQRVAKAPGEIVVITGDISDAERLTKHFAELAEACGSRRLCFVLGNHDYYNSNSLHDVRQQVSELCRRHTNLHFLEEEKIIPLGNDTCLVGHSGWADGRAGFAHRSRIPCPDFGAISAFRGKSHRECFRLMNTLGNDSATHCRKTLPYALTCFRHIVLATHVPPFTQAAYFNEKLCSYAFQPYYTNVALGKTLWGLSGAFPKSQINVLAGHTHSAVSLSLRPNLHIVTAMARTGMPRYEEVISV